MNGSLFKKMNALRGISQGDGSRVLNFFSSQPALNCGFMGLAQFKAEAEAAILYSIGKGGKAAGGKAAVALEPAAFFAL